MNHPTPEELAEFMYGELEPSRQNEVTHHLEACGECRGRVDAWQHVRRELASWQLPHCDAPRFARAATMRWAVAACLLLATGFGLARWTAPGPADPTRLRAELAGEIREQLAAQLTQYATDQRSRQNEFQQAIVQAIKQIETRQVLDHASLREDVETVALHTQEQFQRLAGAENVEATPNTR
jgi:anti-sigma factor RsiW